MTKLRSRARALLLPRQWSFRAHLLVLVLACVGPLIGLAVLTIVWFGLAERDVTRGQVIGTARALASSIDQHLRNVEITLRTVAVLFPQDEEGLRAFYEQSRGIAAQYSGAILLADASGRQIFNTKRPFGTPLPSITDTGTFREAVETREWRISNLFFANVDSKPQYSVYLPLTNYLPIARDDRTPYVLVMSFPAQSVLDLLAAESFSADWIVAAVDRNETILARSKNADKVVGTKSNDSIRSMPKEQRDAFFRRTNVDGNPFYQAVVRASLSGWKIVVQIPQSAVDAPLWQSLRRFAELGSGVLLFAFAAAFVIARYLARDMNTLIDAARALGRREPMPAVASTVREVNRVAATLGEAGMELIDNERQLSRSQQHLLQAQRVAGTGSLERDFKTGEIECTEGFYRLFGVDETTFVPTTDRLLALVHEDDRERVRAAATGTKQGISPPPMEYRIVRPDGEIRMLRREAEVSLDDRGQPTRLLLAFKDVTELRAGEERQRQLERQLHHAQKLEALGTLAGGIAHDLNNTLVPILSLTKLTAKKLPEGSRERNNLSTILQASERARDLVRQILAFSRNEAPTRGIVDLPTLLRDSLKMLCASIPSTIHFEEKIESVPPVLADSGQLHQIIINLVVNASQAIGDKMGTVAIELVAEPPDPKAAPPTLPFVRLSVRDTGCGMDEAVMERIFEPFFTTKAVGEGTGLGLSVVHGIISEHGGRMTVASKVGEGTRFDVYLPALSEEEAARLRAKEIAA